MGAGATAGVGAKAKVGTANGAIAVSVGIAGTVGIPGTGTRAAGTMVDSAKEDLLRALAVDLRMTITSVIAEMVGLSVPAPTFE